MKSQLVEAAIVSLTLKSLIQHYKIKVCIQPVLAHWSNILKSRPEYHTNAVTCRRWQREWAEWIPQYTPVSLR